jgi:hypothetical protein
MRKAIFGAFLSILACAFCPVSWSQNAISNGSISGRVTDTSGGVVSGASVTAKSEETGVPQNGKTNGSGIYNFTSLRVGPYTVTVSHAGFKVAEVKNVIVQVGQNTEQDISLQVGSLSDSVTVTASVPLLRTTESSISTVVDQKLIDDLPLSGRRYTDFVLLAPNVNPDGDFGLVSIGGQQGGADSGYANGNGSNSFTVDGANATSNYFGEARGRTRVPYVFGESTIQEFQVAVSPYSAEYGGAGTGFINTVTKSGTDVLHGQAFYYHRNSATGANDAVDRGNGLPKPLNILHQMGGNVGGAIVHQKAWFFVDYEQQNQSNPISVINSGYRGLTETDFGVTETPAPPLPAPNGMFPVPVNFTTGVPHPCPPVPPAMSCDPNFAVDEPVYLQNVSNILNLFNNSQGQRSRRRNNYTVFPKMDWQPTASDHVAFVYNYSRFDSPGGEFTSNPVSSESVQSLPNNFVHDHHATVHWTHTFNGDLLNDLHVTFVRDDQIATQSGLLPANTPQVLLFPNGFFTLGNPSFAIAETKEMQWAIGEQIAWNHGRHSFKFGFDYNRTHITDFFPGTFLGSYGFFSLSDFALGNWGFFNQSAGNPTFPFTVPYYAFYAQDKFRLRSNLTLDLGLREDFQVYPQPQGNPAFPLTGQFPNQYQRLAPRLGFAYQPFSKTVIRGGFGMFYEIFNAINYENSVISNGLPSRQSSASPSFDGKKPPNQQTPTFPNILPVNNGAFAGSSNLSLVSPSFKVPYILESNLEIQREIMANTTVAIGSMWTHAVHLASSSAFDLNLNPLPAGTTTYVVCPAGVGVPGAPADAAHCPGAGFTGPTLDSALLTDTRLTTNFNQINALISPGVNNYNSFYFQLQRRMTRGLSAQLAYTFSKAILSNGADFNNQFDFRDTHGPSLLDQRHRLSIATVYSPDASHLSDGVTKTLLSNWTISTVMGFNSGRPYTAVLGGTCTGVDSSNCSTNPFPLPNGDNINSTNFNQGTGNTAAGINGGGSPSPTQGFNSFYGPWINEIDLGLARALHISERHTITLKGGGVNSTQYQPFGTNCGNGALTQTCFLVPQSGFGALNSVSELNGPRILQGAFIWNF